MARILILRDAAAASTTIEAVRDHGHEPVLLPLQEIAPLDPALPAGPFGGLVATSANAVPWLSRHFPAGAPPLLVVGARTAAAARDAGFSDVREGAGNALSLLSLARELAKMGRLLYAAGKVREPDFEAALHEEGTPFVAVDVYEARIRKPDRGEAERAIGRRGVDAVLLLSAGQARGFSALAATCPDLFAPLPRLLCLSGRIAAALPEDFRTRVLAADAPELSAVLARYRSEAAS